MVLRRRLDRKRVANIIDLTKGITCGKYQLEKIPFFKIPIYN